MSERYLSEITLFAGSYAPQRWAYCAGSLLPVSSNEALYSLLGTLYGGDGRTTFSLPDLRGRVPVGRGGGNGLTPRNLGQRMGQEYVTLTLNQLPEHRHSLMAADTPATSSEPASNLVVGKASQFVASPVATDWVALQQDAVNTTGGGERHLNVAPSLALNFIICTAGIYPQRS
ncbi:tail fiber protein [Photobacterium sp. WH77]|uniref:Phage tail protein n=1 Tax=Photobacterium arenosum TaxID=2774143 RepID=A0ABR9BHP5_9GAMM|nr:MULTISPECIES: tail fiber protein [Photobacterium]MBD8512064.1 phage tail protein [Photobacterium arenosum]MBV7261749.1 phage tail protein [Photobacterium sp. WH24]MCG2836129.1 tail fiber protein [Photobacterium sp. WH77]MCG2843734.1 tail fiber protein [Photobacterium sp. WH80]MDO6581165.1 tail fiber protein [Photobacterium sp. 2_MG-2023]